MKTRVLQPSDQNLDLCAKTLQEGGLVGIPTETVYGLAANAFDESACGKIFEVKQRPLGDPLILHVAEDFPVGRIARENPLFSRLRKVLWPGPVTFVLEKTERIAPILTAGLPSVAIRCPAHPVMKRLLERCPFPVAAPSANPFGYISPTSAQHVESSLGGKILYILEGGSCEVGLESTILDVREPQKIRLLRPGTLSLELLRKTVPEVDIEIVGKQPETQEADEDLPREAPGTLWRHYSPRKPLFLLSDRNRLEKLWSPEKPIALLLHTRPPQDFLAKMPGDKVTLHWLSEDGDQKEMAHRLYARLRDLDASPAAEIWAESIPAGPFSQALNDRLKRAAAD